MNPVIRDWTGRRVWLVGASSGIGAALAVELARRGARVALSARRVDRLYALARSLPQALVLPCDVSDEVALSAARATLDATWGGIDLAIYLAGDYVPMGAADFDLPRAERILDVTFNGAMRLTSTLLPELRAGAGIAFVASVAGYRGLPRSLCYGPGKAALIHFAECLHLELAPRGIGVWVVNPGFVRTRLTEGNDFAMPGLLTAEQAALETVEGFADGRFEIHYPKHFTRVLKFLALLPYRWYFPLVRRLTGARA